MRFPGELSPLQVPVTSSKSFVEAMAWHDVKKIINVKPRLWARQMLHLILAGIEVMCARQVEASVFIPPLNQVAVEAPGAGELGTVLSGWINAQV